MNDASFECPIESLNWIARTTEDLYIRFPDLLDSLKSQDEHDRKSEALFVAVAKGVQAGFFLTNDGVRDTEEKIREIREMKASGRTYAPRLRGEPRREKGAR